HPTGECAYFVERDIGRVTDSALGWAAGDGGLDADAGKDFEMAVIHLNGNMQDDFPGGIAQDLPQTLIKVELVGGQIESGRLRFPRVGFLLDGNAFHEKSPRKWRCVMCRRYSSIGTNRAVYGRGTGVASRGVDER